MTTEVYDEPKPGKTAPKWMFWAAWAVPVLMAGDLARLDTGWYAALPIGALVYGVLRERSVRALRYWVGVLAVLFAVPFFLTENGVGIVQDMHWANLGAFGLVMLVVLGKLYRSHRG